jgi:nicotinamide-nucleotide amidase
MASRNERAAIVSIGDELTIGQSLDTNSKWLSERLTEIGLTVVEHVTVPDDREWLGATLRRLCEACATVVVSGGLGPTADDLTRESLADVLNEPLDEDGDSLRAIEAWFARSSREMPRQNRVQALRPRSGVHIPNPNGTAPGVHVTVLGAAVFCLPGPPSEMRPMFEAYVRARVSPPEGRLIRTRVFQTMGVGESEIAQRLGGLMARDRNPLVGTTASAGMVSVRIRYEGSESAERVDRLMAETAADVERLVGDVVFAEGGRPLADVVIDRLRRAGQRVATVESCTGGMLGGAMTALAGSSDVYLGGWVTYSNEMKGWLVGVGHDLLERHGAVSEEVAAAMAVGGLERSGADHCLAITGVAGPGGGTPEKPVGTVWVGMASRGVGEAGGVECRRFLMRGERETVRQWSVTSALAMLDLRLRGRSELKLLRQQAP